MKQFHVRRLLESEGPFDPPQPVSGLAKQEGSDEIPRSFFRYTISGPVVRPVGDVKLVEAIPPGMYKINSDMGGIYFERVKPQTDALLVFEDSPMHKVVKEIETFWNRKAEYDKLGLLHCRGLIVYGPPGSGKTLAMQQVGEAMAKQGDLVFLANSPGQIAGALQAARQIEPNRRIVVSFEEADELASYDERTLLRLMDGDQKVNNVLYLATTNYIDRMSPRMLRPGRFDKRVYVGPPKFEHRLKYLQVKLKGIAEDSLIQDMAKKTEGLSFGHLRELISGAFAIGDPVDEVIMRLRDSRNIAESANKIIRHLHANKLTEGKKSLREGRNSPAVTRLLG